MPAGRLREDARRARPGCAPVAAGRSAAHFNRQSVWKRIAIVLAGPVANLLLAIARLLAAERRRRDGAAGAARARRRRRRRPRTAGVAATATAWSTSMASRCGHGTNCGGCCCSDAVEHEADRAAGRRHRRVAAHASRSTLSGIVTEDLDRDFIARLGIVPYSGAAARRPRRRGQRGGARRACSRATASSPIDGKPDRLRRDALIERVRASAGQAAANSTVERDGESVRDAA